MTSFTCPKVREFASIAGDSSLSVLKKIGTIHLEPSLLIYYQFPDDLDGADTVEPWLLGVDEFGSISLVTAAAVSGSI